MFDRDDDSMISRIAITIAMTILSGCQNKEATLVTTETTPVELVSPPSPPPPPPANFSEKDGDIYLYTTALSENDKKEGKATGEVVGYKYLGESDGVYRLASVDDSDSQFATSECKTPCLIIVRRFRGKKDRIAFSENSVIGSAFLDAFNGHLQVTKTKRGSPKPKPETAQSKTNTDSYAEDEGPDVPIAKE
jgi:hypothetical protein